MSERVQAWLLDVGAPHGVALGKHEIIEVLEDVPAVNLPVGPPWCNRVLPWRRRLLPLVALGRLEQTEVTELPGRVPIVIVVGFQRAAESPVEYGAIELNHTPTGIWVEDEQEASLPNGLPASWRGLVIACFLHEGDLVLTPDLLRLFVPVRSD